VLTAESITLYLAIWGALTGTIGLLIRLRDMLKDRGSLKIEVCHEPGHEEDLGLYAEISNLGRRPLSMRKIVIYYSSPETFRLHDPQTMVVSLGQEERRLVEGSTHRLKLGDYLSVADWQPSIIERLTVHDSQNRVWRSKRRVGERALMQSRFAGFSILLKAREFQLAEKRVELLGRFHPFDGWDRLSMKRFSVRESVGGTADERHFRFRWQLKRAYRRRYDDLLMERIRQQAAKEEAR